MFCLSKSSRSILSLLLWLLNSVYICIYFYWIHLNQLNQSGVWLDEHVRLFENKCLWFFPTDLDLFKHIKGLVRYVSKFEWINRFSLNYCYSVMIKTYFFYIYYEIVWGIINIDLFCDSRNRFCNTIEKNATSSFAQMFFVFKNGRIDK